MTALQKRRIVDCAKACVRALERADFWATRSSPVMESGSRIDAAFWAGAAFEIAQRHDELAHAEAMRRIRPGAAA